MNLSETSILYLIRHASVILIVCLHQLRPFYANKRILLEPWNQNSDAQWAQTINLSITVQTRSLLNYVCW